MTPSQIGVIVRNIRRFCVRELSEQEKEKLEKLSKRRSIALVRLVCSYQLDKAIEQMQELGVLNSTLDISSSEHGKLKSLRAWNKKKWAKYYAEHPEAKGSHPRRDDKAPEEEEKDHNETPEVEPPAQDIVVVSANTTDWEKEMLEKLGL
jgi:hypothetical protein